MSHLHANHKRRTDQRVRFTELSHPAPDTSALLAALSWRGEGQ